MKNMEKTVSRLITNGMINGFNLSIVENVFGTAKVYTVNIKQNEGSFFEIKHNAVLGVNNLEDIKFKISASNIDLKISEVDRYVQDLKDAEFAVAEFNKYIQMTK